MHPRRTTAWTGESALPGAYSVLQMRMIAPAAAAMGVAVWLPMLLLLLHPTRLTPDHVPLHLPAAPAWTPPPPGPAAAEHWTAPAPAHARAPRHLSRAAIGVVPLLGCDTLMHHQQFACRSAALNPAHAPVFVGDAVILMTGERLCPRRCLLARPSAAGGVAQCFPGDEFRRPVAGIGRYPWLELRCHCHGLFLSQLGVLCWSRPVVQS